MRMPRTRIVAVPDLMVMHVAVLGTMGAFVVRMNAAEKPPVMMMLHGDWGQRQSVPSFARDTVQAQRPGRCNRDACNGQHSGCENDTHLLPPFKR